MANDAVTSTEQRKALADIPNALGFQRIIETETNGYLVRQYLYSSLYDRLSTRPFLEDIEKKWLAFQLLCALRDCHARDIYHGDIKAQNIVVTSWNWLYLTDFSSAFKPVMLPDGNPGDFSYFFDSSGRRTCYIAPERFYASGEGSAPPKEKMTWAMDVFSAGCVIAQMFLESEIFSLAQLYKYRRGEYDPVITHLSVISDKDVREMISHMIQLDPEKRYSAEQYLDFWKGKVFPTYFYNFLHQYMELITDPSSGNNPMSGAQKNMGESDDRIDRVYYDFDKISYFLGYQPEKGRESSTRLTSRLGLDHFPVQLSIPNHEHTVSADLEPPEDDGTLIFLTLIVSAMRTTARVTSRVRACDILLAFAERLTDEAKLDRVLPYLMTLLRKEETDLVMISAIRTITQLLQLVKMVTPINSHVLVEYVLPRLEVVLGSKHRVTSPLVRATYASCLGSLATTAQRFLEMASSLRADGSMPITDPEIEPGADAEANFESVFDNAGRQLFEILETHVKALVEDPDVHVRRAFLASVPELCMFFQEHSNDVLLTHLLTYLNDRDWTLKCAFFDTIVGIATFIGSTSLEEFMLPLMIQALADKEEYVVQAALHSLAQLAALGLLSRTKLWEMVDLVSKFAVHPNIWIREAAAEFVAMSASYLEPADVRCILTPLVTPYLTVRSLPDFEELTILNVLQKPLSRAVFEQAVAWAAKADRGNFWKQMQKSRPGSTSVLTLPSSGDRAAGSLGKMSLTQEDEQWLGRLRNLGLKSEDESKLVALADFIWRISKMKARDSSPGDASMVNGIVSLTALGIQPQIVFFNETSGQNGSLPVEIEQEDGPYTIENALLDASMTIDESGGKRKQAMLNAHKRVHSVGPRTSTASDRLLSPTGVERASSQDSRASAMARTDSQPSVQDNNFSQRRAIRQSASALNLIDRKDSNKSIPETGTSGTNAFGEMEGPFAQPLDSHGAGTSDADQKASKKKLSRHTYEGGDPSVQKMLDNMYLDNYPRDIVEFGPMVQPVSKRETSNSRGSAQCAETPWRPDGNLVATFSEHKGPVSRVAVSPDHVFFITGGYDGSVRVWDTARLERNITHRSRQTHRHAADAKVLALCFIENTHCFVSCASDGSVHVVKVDTVTASGVVRYGKLRLLREYQLPEGERAIWCEHFKQESSSVLLLATNRSRLLAIDLRTMTLLYVLENPVHHGAPTCFCVDRKRNWLCVGTAHGIVDLWDLRFRMRLRGWGIPGGRGPIHRLAVHPNKGRLKWLCVSGGTGRGEITVWDLEKMACREVYRTGSESVRGASARQRPLDTVKTYEAWDVDDDKPEGMLARYATGELDEDVETGNDGGVHALAMGTELGSTREVRHAFFLTGGSDRRLRFWDLSRIEKSSIYSGMILPGSEELQAPKATYASSQPGANLTLNVEKLPKSGGTASSSGGSKTSGGSSSRPSRATVISKQQGQLLQSHMDGVTDMVVLERPYLMSVSVDRSGVVFVFQ